MRAEAEFWRPEPHHDATVERVAGDCAARGAEHGTTTSFLSAWSKTSKREVARAAAEVSDQNQLVAIELRLILVSGSDRPQLKRDLLEPGELSRSRQPL